MIAFVAAQQWFYRKMEGGSKPDLDCSSSLPASKLITVLVMRFAASKKALIRLTAFSLLAQTASAEVDFAMDIQPILNENCVECHGGVKAAGGVSFVYEDQVINFIGDSGLPIVKPGKPDDSELIYRITTSDEEDRMPPPDEHDALTDDQIALFKKWINE